MHQTLVSFCSSYDTCHLPLAATPLRPLKVSTTGCRWSREWWWWWWWWWRGLSGVVALFCLGCDLICPRLADLATFPCFACKLPLRWNFSAACKWLSEAHNFYWLDWLITGTNLDRRPPPHSTPTPSSNSFSSDSVRMVWEGMSQLIYMPQCPDECATHPVSVSDSKLESPSEAEPLENPSRTKGFKLTSSKIAWSDRSTRSIICASL